MAAKSKRKHRRKFWIGLILLLIAVGIGILMQRSGVERPIEVTIEQVRNRTITSVVSATGKIHPVIEVKISSEVSGEIIELSVREGARVEKGDLLARIRSDTYQSQVRQREAAVSAARSNSLQRKAEMLQSELEYNRTRDLNARGFATQSQVDAARTHLEVHRASYQASLYHVEQQETHLDEAREELDRTTIRAPIAGTISRLSVEAGERVVGTGLNPGTELLSVADLSAMEVRVEVSENEVVDIMVGDTARVTVDALRNKEFRGEVVEISSSALFVPGERRQEEITAFEVRIRLQEHDPAIRPGMTATADIETDTVEDVPAVPLQSVTIRDRSDVPGLTRNSDSDESKTSGSRSRRDRLQRVVFVVDGDRVEMRAVETGIADNSYLEIKSGIRNGERIVSGSYSAITRQLAHGSRISESALGSDGWRQRSEN